MQRIDEDLYTYYNWQFLRRNPVYRAEYDQYILLLKTDESKADGMVFNLVKTWGMSSYLDWRIEKPEFLPNLFFEPISNFGLFSYEHLTASKNPIDNFVQLRPGDEQKDRFLLVALDLEKFRSKDYTEFLKDVSKIQNEYELKAKGEIQRVTSKPEHLDVLLATYDEQQKNPKSSSYEIAQKLISLYAEQNLTPSQHTQKVEGNLARAQGLIAIAPNILFDFS